MTRCLAADHRGWTLPEVLVASAMALVVFVAITFVYQSGLKVQRNARESYYISQGSSVALRTLRHDLSNTALSSIRVEDEGFSLLSAFPIGKTDGFSVNRYGAPSWQKTVFYRTIPTGDGSSTLMRWEQPYSSSNPAPRLAPPAEGTVPSNAHPLLRDVLSRGYSVEPGPDGVYRLMPKAEVTGGFSLGFVRTDTELSRDNPASFSDAQRSNWTKNTTRLVQLELQVISTPSDSKISTFKLKMVVCPRN